MKYIVLLGDGMADRPMEELGGETPLMAAKTPNMDSLAARGTVGMAHTIPQGFEPGSDVANMCILGYDPKEFYSGRAPLEAASMGVELADADVAFRCNLVTLEDRGGTIHMVDHSSGHITSNEAAGLIKSVSSELSADGIRFYPGVSYRHLLVWAGGPVDARCTPPHDILGEPIASHLPEGAGSDSLRKMMERSWPILKDHPVNRKRAEAGKNQATSIWLWGQGKRPRFTPFLEKFGKKGAMISAVDLTKGLAVCAGMKSIDVPGATGWIDTNYQGKVEHALGALEEADLVYLHVEAPDEAGHAGSVKDKLTAIEDFDAKVVGPVVEGLRKLGDYRILLMPDHPTPIEIRTHSDEPVPFVVYDSTSEKNSGVASYDEGIAASGNAIVLKEGHTLMAKFIDREI